MKATLAILLALSLLAAACGNDNDTQASSSASAETAAADVETQADPDGTEPEAAEVETASDNADAASGAASCDAEPTVMATSDGVDFVRTPDACFVDLPDWPYSPAYVEIDGLRQAYIDEGPNDGEVVLLLHGQPSWSYLYRHMIPVFTEAGYRVIAMDHLGMGRSDKPVDIEAYSYVGHADRLETFIDDLNLTGINLFVQDWGSLIGLKVAGENPDLFATITVGDGSLPTIPEGVVPFPPVENPDEVLDLESLFASIPEQQPVFYDGCELIAGGEVDFGEWIAYALTAESFHASEVVEAMTWYDLTPEVEAVYDAPFPNRTYMAGPRVFPSLANQLGGTTDEAWSGLQAYDKPFLTLWAANDPGNLGRCETQQRLIDNVPGAAGQPHDRLPEASHFLQDDQGTEIATRMVDWLGSAPSTTAPVTNTGGGFSLNGFRYCEILLAVEGDGGTPVRQVWGTQGVGPCRDEVWYELDPDAIAAEFGASGIHMNGPRYFVVDGSVDTGQATTDAETGAREIRDYGGIDMQLLATIDESTFVGAYESIRVLRTATWTFNAGTEVYELTDPEGNTYLMQSYSLIQDPDLTADDLATLGDRLELPDGWSYNARVLDQDMQVPLSPDGGAIVVQDELENTYQRSSF